MLDFSDLVVYLVEPSAVQQRAIVAGFHERGVRNISTFGSAMEMLHRLDAEPPSLVASALYLPDMSGTELVQCLRENPESEHIPFILISSEIRPHVLDPVRQSGVCGILPKPFSPEQLQLALRATLDYLDESAALDVDGDDLESLRVLLVDDSPSARKFSRRVLENVGIRYFTEAENGREAIQILSSTMVDLVVTDYNMPEMDGLALVEFIRKESWQSTVPILMVTSESDVARLAAVEGLGVSGICDKPFQPATIKAHIAKILHDTGRYD